MFMISLSVKNIENKSFLFWQKVRGQVEIKGKNANCSYCTFLFGIVSAANATYVLTAICD